MKYLNDVTTKDCVGKVCKSLNSGDFKILKYKNSKNVEIQFSQTGYETTVQLTNIKSGSIKDKYSPSVCGVGIVGTKHPSRVSGVKTKEYVLWCNMLERCYSTNLKKKRPTYIGYEVSENYISWVFLFMNGGVTSCQHTLP